MTRSGSTALALVEEALAGLWRARQMTFVSILMIGVSIYLVGLFFLLAENLRGVVETVRNETVVTVFLSPAVSAEERGALESVARDSGLVSAVRHVDPEEARRRFSASWGSLSSAAASLPTNPFPATLELDLLPEALASRALPGLLSNLKAQKGAEEVQFDVEWIRRLRGAVELARASGILVGVLLVAGAAFTIANVVRLTILLHRDEVEILRLVGAPELLIRGPFLLGGLLQGLLGALLALAVLWASFRGLVLHVSETRNALLAVFVVRFLPPATAAALVGGGVLAGLLGGAVAARKRDV